MILANHDNKISKISQLFLRVETLDWSKQVTTDECIEILAQSYNDSNNINTVFDLYKACIQVEYGATNTHSS